MLKTEIKLFLPDSREEDSLHDSNMSMCPRTWGHDEIRENLRIWLTWLLDRARFVMIMCKKLVRVEEYFAVVRNAKLHLSHE